MLLCVLNKLALSFIRTRVHRGVRTFAPPPYTFVHQEFDVLQRHCRLISDNILANSNDTTTVSTYETRPHTRVEIIPHAAFNIDKYKCLYVFIYLVPPAEINIPKFCVHPGVDNCCHSYCWSYIFAGLWPNSITATWCAIWSTTRYRAEKSRRFGHYGAA